PARRAVVPRPRMIQVVHVEDLVTVGYSGRSSLVDQEPVDLSNRRGVVPAVRLLTAFERLLLDLQPDDAHGSTLGGARRTFAVISSGHDARVAMGVGDLRRSPWVSTAFPETTRNSAWRC